MLAKKKKRIGDWVPHRKRQPMDDGPRRWPANDQPLSMTSNQPINKQQSSIIHNNNNNNNKEINN